MHMPVDERIGNKGEMMDREKGSKSGTLLCRGNSHTGLAEIIPWIASEDLYRGWSVNSHSDGSSV